MSVKVRVSNLCSIDASWINIAVSNDWDEHLDAFVLKCELQFVWEYFDNDWLSMVNNGRRVQVQREDQDSMKILNQRNLFRIWNFSFFYLVFVVLVHTQIEFHLPMDLNLIEYGRLIRINKPKSKFENFVCFFL